MNHRFQRVSSVLCLGFFLLSAAGADSSAPAPVPPLNRKISGDYYNKSAKEILADVTQKAGLKYQIDPEVLYEFEKTRVTVSFENQEVWRSIGTLCDLFGATNTTGVLKGEDVDSPIVIVYILRRRIESYKNFKGYNYPERIDIKVPTPVSGILAQMAHEAGIILIIDPTAADKQGPGSADFPVVVEAPEMPFHDAFDMVIRAAGLSYRVSEVTPGTFVIRVLPGPGK